MAQVAHGHPQRISQVLPTVKCSSCGLLVPLASLGDHVCSSNAQRPHSRSVSNREKPSEDSKHALAPTRDPFQRLSPSPKVPPTLLSHTPDRIPTPTRDALPPALQRVRTPSNTTPQSPARAGFTVQFADPPTRPPPARPAGLSPARRDNLPPPPSPRSPFTNHALSSVTPPPTIRPRPSFERPPTASSTSTSRPSLDKSRPSPDNLVPSLDARRPSLEPHNTSLDQNRSATPSAPFARSPRTAPPPAPGTVPFPVLPPPVSTRQPPLPTLSLVHPRTHNFDREIDTKTGGEAGMAGVGRRGFAAAARAAMLSASLSPALQPPTNVHRPNVPQYLDTSTALAHVMRGKSSFDPTVRHLTISPAATMTPPSSPNSVQTPSPVSPFPASPVPFGNATNGPLPRLPSPHDAMSRQSPVPAAKDKTLSRPFSPGVRIASPSRSPSPTIPNPFERRLSGETITQSPMSGNSLPLPFLDVLKPDLDLGSGSDDESVYTSTDLKRDESTPPSPLADSEFGLAYAHDSDDDTPVVMPLDIRKSAMSWDRRHAGPSRQISAASLRSAASASSATSFAGVLHSRSTSAATHTTTRSAGALARAMETLIEEGASVSVLASGSVLASIGAAPSRGSGKPSRSNTVPGPTSPEHKAPKLPTRSHTNPSHPHVHAERVGVTAEVARIWNRGSVKRKDRSCARCKSKIEDGRWIQMDGGSVLCERCWKNMYLPKCRRCNLPIEKQAVSSRDGQLKGKYHKNCFSCHVCQKPFPDKEFYVFDGKPFCAYHYHEANNSLCGASSCGQPVEGPCAVTHSGKRYHPEHLLCEFEDGCKEKLEEYWEVDGQMLCERHAALIGNRDSSWTRSDDLSSDTHITKPPATDEGRIMKRMTRFIDLGAGGDDELDIR